LCTVVPEDEGAFVGPAEEVVWFAVFAVEHEMHQSSIMTRGI
jgi:hypothetical protein